MKELHIHPTKQCNRNCSFCSYRYNHTNEQLPTDYVCDVLRQGKELGYTNLRLAGGGEPLLHKDILTILSTAKFYNYDVALQTNGDNLSFIHKKFCKDIRVSLGDGIKFNPQRHAQHYIQPNGYNYVVTALPDYDLLNKVIKYAIANNQYVSVVTDETDILNTPTIAEIQQHGLVSKLGPRIPSSDLISFHDGKAFHKGKKSCPSTHLMLSAVGYWVPCGRTQFSKGKNLTDYDTTMRLGKQYDSLSVVTNIDYNGRKCKRCYY